MLVGAIGWPEQAPKRWLWYKPESLPSAGTRMTVWADSSGNGFDAVAVTSPSGYYRPIVAAGPGGFNAARFDLTPLGGTAALLIPTAAYDSLTAVEMFTVVKSLTSGTPPDGEAGGIFQVGGANFDAAHYPYGDGDIYDDFGSTSRRRFTPYSALTSWHCYNVVSTSAEWTAKMNGHVEKTDASNLVAWVTATGLDGQAMGTTMRPSGVYFPGHYDVVETIWFDGKLSDAARGTVEAYLAGRFGITFA